MATAPFHFLDAGGTIVMEYGPDKQEAVLPIAEACDRTDFGKWFCAKCRFGLNNFELEAHRSHGIVWMCFEHGPEAVPKDERPAD